MRSARRGIAIIWVCITVVVMLGIVGLALDTGYGVLVGYQLQDGADATALAGAQTVATDQVTARARAVATGTANKAAGTTLAVDANTDVVLGYFHPNTKVFTATNSLPNAVRAYARRTTAAHGAVPLFFGGAFGKSNVDMSREAIATINTSISPALLVMDPTGERALDITGSPRVRVPNGGVLVNSNHSEGTRLGGSCILDTQSLSVTTSSIPNISHLTGTLNTERAPQPDPLAALPAPTPGSPVQNGKLTIGTNQNVTINAGYYPGGINVRGTLTMNPGIYIVDDDFEANSGATIVGNGVMVYLRGSANLGFNSNNLNLTLNPPDPNVHSFTGVNTYAGITIFQQRGNTATSGLQVSGTVSLNGTIYIPSAQIDLTASGGSGGVKLIVWRLNVAGSGDLTITGLNDISTTGNPYLVK